MNGWFSLEAVYAKKGDALILHYGSKEKPKWILIDGGHDKVYEQFLQPRLEELRLHRLEQLGPDKPLPLEMVMVSHADADHLQGILDLTAHMRSDDPGRPPAPVSIDKFWFNSFDDLVENPESADVTAIMDGLAQTASFDEIDGLAIPVEMRKDDDLRAVIASTKQGRQLRNDAEMLVIDLNPEYDGELVMRGGDHPSVTKHSPGMKFTLLGPDQERISKLRKKWKKDLKKILKNTDTSADAASFKDTSAFNLSSIMVLAERGGKSILLTGDARGDDLIAGLDSQNLLDNNGKIHVDVFKLPHHGSDRNVKIETFRDITAENYLISANGEHGNPEPATLDMLIEGRKQSRNDKFNLYLTFPEEAFKLISEEQANKKKTLRKQKDALEAIDEWIKTKKPSNCEICYRDQAKRSIAIDLANESVFPDSD